MCRSSRGGMDEVRSNALLISLFLVILNIKIHSMTYEQMAQ